MQWEPDHHGWMAYIKFEIRGGEVPRARDVFERYVACLPGTKAWVRFAKFEAENGDLGRSRQVYERAMQVRPPTCLYCRTAPSQLSTLQCALAMGVATGPVACTQPTKCVQRQ